MTVEESATEAGAPTVAITIRGVPLELRNELASRAALEGKSMQRYLLTLLERTVARPSMAALMESIRKRAQAAGTRLSIETILGTRDGEPEERREAARPRSPGPGRRAPDETRARFLPAGCPTDGMAVEAGPKTAPITIRRVPREVRNELAARAAHEGRSLQRYLFALLRRTVSYSSRSPATACLPKQVWLQRIRERKRAAGIRLSVEEILNTRDADRR